MQQPRLNDGRWGEIPHPEPDKINIIQWDESDPVGMDFAAMYRGLMRDPDGHWTVRCGGCEFEFTHEKPSMAIVMSGVKFNPKAYRSGRDVRRLCLDCRTVEAVADADWLW